MKNTNNSLQEFVVVSETDLQNINGGGGFQWQCTVGSTGAALAGGATGMATFCK